MKPKNRVVCPDCGRHKMLFESQKKAESFIRWNGDSLDRQDGELRSYYCPACCAWHISHKEHHRAYDNRTDRLIEAYKKQKSIKTRIDMLIHHKDYDKEVDDVITQMPDIIWNGSSKTKIRRFLTEYFKRNGIQDNSSVRFAIYEKWKKHRLKLQAMK